MRVSWLVEQGRYEERDRSKALPELPLQELVRFLKLRHEKSTTRLASEFRAWVREHGRKGA